VAQDVDTTRRKGKEIGLLLNDKKREFISKTAISTSTNSAFRNFVHLRTEQYELLGAPLTTGTAMDMALSHRCDDLCRAATRLGSIVAYDALVSLKASFSALKLMHTTRASPCSGHPARERFDGPLRECVGLITNADLNDIQ
jgi:hypothetical protein